MQACKVPSSMWSKIGRLKRSVMPKLARGSTIFGSGASPGIMSCIAGFLLCDAYLCSRDLLKEIEYDETDAWLSMDLMFHLRVLPLTRQLTNISGNLWGKTLQNNWSVARVAENLVQRRRMVKSWMKNASGLKVQQLDIQQQALKLTANRFVSLLFLQFTCCECVIYGDTDSIMIYSGLDDIAKAKAMAGKVIQEVNKKYRCLKIDLDGLYKRMLLLKKKKYASYQGAVQRWDSVVKRKGLDIVRRDWSLLSKEQGDFCLRQILSGGSLMKVQEEMRSGQVSLEKYIITKTLTKPPDAYPDAKNQLHVLGIKRCG
ncbi:hypothetical protein L6164_019899 [Bauhinia variegata]|uniref:Uncharacterized protein n=1 Tax=Bauhinia variegata TaxID=167791 RepID=A0ACB9MVA4_BAUVA|nr:hypothetical protein L6164_019899 [Bauhinia variegata]